MKIARDTLSKRGRDFKLPLAGVMGSVLTLLLAGCAVVTPTPSGVDLTPVQGKSVLSFVLKSNAFGLGEPIPARYSCDGPNLSPPLSWMEVPPGTVSFALLMDDPDASGFTHWVLFNLPGDLHILPDSVPKVERPDVGGIQGRNDFGKIGYGGPCPPGGQRHRYRFFIYALDTTLALEPGSTKSQVLSAAQGHILGQALSMSTYQRERR